jgi:hypothetical protein
MSEDDTVTAPYFWIRWNHCGRGGMKEMAFGRRMGLEIRCTLTDLSHILPPGLSVIRIDDNFS